MKKESNLLYFDITDILVHAASHRRVTGIQRVVVNVIRDIAEKHGERARCIFYSDVHGKLMDCDPRDLFHEGEFESLMLVYKLGMVEGWGYFPSKDETRRYLRPYEGKKIRKLKKLEVHISSLLFPARLRRMGLQRICDLFNNVKRVPIRSFSGLKPGDSLIMLGANWCVQGSAMDELMQQQSRVGGEVVQMIYDLIPICYPQYCDSQHVSNFSRWLEQVVPYVSRYFCISESSARDLREYIAERGYNKTCTVVPLAHEFAGAARNSRVGTAPAVMQSGSERPYVLCVGTIEIRKNGVTLLRAWLRLHEELGERLPLLIFAGRDGWRTEEFDELLKEHEVLRRFVSIIYSPSDAELAWLYGNCLFTAFPSLCEGWGLPVGEAAWFGKYCVASNASSIPEVCGDLIDYVAPTDENDLVEKLRRAIVDTDYLRSRERAIAVAPLRTWKDVVSQMATLIVEPARSGEASGKSDAAVDEAKSMGDLRRRKAE